MLGTVVTGRSSLQPLTATGTGSSLVFTSPQELACHMGLHSVTCHLGYLQPGRDDIYLGHIYFRGPRGYTINL